MNELMNVIEKMSSLEIAKITGKDHNNVLRDIRRLSERGLLKKAQGGYYTSKQNKQLPLYLLNKTESFIAISQLAIDKLRAVVDRWGYSENLLREIISALEAFDVPEDMKDMFVYAMQNTITGNIKLGISRDPAARLKQLQTGNDCKLELVAYCKAKNGFSDETALHHKYSSVHIMGEWFDSTAINAIGA